jgi:hypothetical protein
VQGDNDIFRIQTNEKQFPFNGITTPSSHGFNEIAFVQCQKAFM